MRLITANLNKIKAKREINPFSTVKIIKGNKNVAKLRENEMKIQMLSGPLYRQIFGSYPKEVAAPDLVEKWKSDLIRHGIDIETSPKFDEVDLKLPKFKGANIEEHFYNIAKEQCREYESLIEAILIKNIPAKPKTWSYTSGWTKYCATTGESTSVPYPDELVLVFDVEVCMSYGKMPTLATAMGPTCWYSWVSPNLIEDRPRQTTANYTIDGLIPIESGENRDADLESHLKLSKLIIGHNVSFDRSKVKEQYWSESTGTRFLDTMSLHICVSGVTSYQRAVLKSHKEIGEEDLGWSGQTSLNSLVEVYKLYCKKELSKERRDIFFEGTHADVRNDFQNLVDYCADDVIATHSVFAELYPLFHERFSHPATLCGMLEIGSAYLPINHNWNRYLNEADLAYEDLTTESKSCLVRRANEVCKLLENDQYKKDLWMWDQDWSVQEFKLKKSATKTKSTEPAIVAEKSYENLSPEERAELIRLEEKFKDFHDRSKQLLPARRQLLSGYPAWYRKLCLKPNDEDWAPGPQNIGTGMQIVPKILHLCWEGYPLHFIRDKGWGFLVPYKSERDDECQDAQLPLEELVKKCPVIDSNELATRNESDEALGSLWKDVEINLSKKQYYNKKKLPGEYHRAYRGTGVWCNTDLENCCWFFKLPHKDGPSNRVGNPMAKDFLNKFSENVLSGDGEMAERIIEIARMCSYWRNNRDRIHGQMAVYHDDQLQFGAIIPQVVVCGTLTRRAMEPTWMTASNAQRERIGSELRGMIQAPPGYKIVGADVDSQELWIAAVLGDANETKTHGATPFGWMTLSGSKSNSTDMHSVTAKAIGISRDHAKVINYARIYGAGQNFAERLLKQFNPTISDGEARSKAMKMFALTKGKKLYYLKTNSDDGAADGGVLERRGYSAYEAAKLAAAYNQPISDLFEKPKWHGGTESAMFNRLEEIAEMEKPVTPFLQCRLSRALETADGEPSNDRFLPTRVNWVVQSGAVDFLHLMLVCMRWLMGSKIRFCLSFHDEVRYLVRDEDAYKAALAMHVTNLLTRSYCAKRIGLVDLPQSIAFFTSVEVDTVLRKESQMDCKTPSNPHGLANGYGIAAGESLSVYEAIEKAGGGNLSKWRWHQTKYN